LVFISSFFFIYLFVFTSTKEEFEDTKGLIGIPKSKDRQHNGQIKKDKRTNNYLQNTTQKTKDRATRTPLETGD
jgi:hypothetical protein